MQTDNRALAIELKKVVKDFPGVRAINDINFSVKSGTVHGFLGPNGAGKSTTMNIIAGLFPATSGEIKYFGSHEKAEIGFLPENPPLYMNMKVCDYLIFVAKIYHVPKKMIKGKLVIPAKEEPALLIDLMYPLS